MCIGLERAEFKGFGFQVVSLEVQRLGSTGFCGSHGILAGICLVFTELEAAL